MRTSASRDPGSPRGGFTLVEMLVVTVLGALLLAATYQILITNQRTYTAQAGKVEGMQATRGALEVLTGELREINTSDGDLVSMDSTEITFRSLRRFGLVCAVTYGATPTVRVEKYEAFFADGDSVMVFAENDGNTAGDDVWVAAYVTASDSTVSCNGDSAQTLRFGGQASLLDPASGGDSVSPGAPVRSFVHYTYGKDSVDGMTVLARTSGTATVPVVGPLDAAGGLRFTYLDEDGNVTTTPTDVAQILVSLKSTAQMTTSTGNTVMDSLTVRIFPRNN